MSDIKTAVAKSHNIKDAALNLNLKAYELRRTLAAVWDLKPTLKQPPSPETTFSLDMKNEGYESVLGDDERLLVDKVHFAPGGKYRCNSISIAFLLYDILMWLRSNCKALHPLRVPETAQQLGHGYRLAY